MACLRKKKKKTHFLEGLPIDDSALFLAHPTNPLGDLYQKLNPLLLILSLRK
jgi:hypothetical protein